jgi:hypothetical protein
MELKNLAKLSFGNMDLYTDSNPNKTIKVGFKNKFVAIESIQKIKSKSKAYQIKVINTLYYRAKYHPHKTKEIKEAMKIFKKWLNKNK